MYTRVLSALLLHDAGGTAFLQNGVPFTQILTLSPQTGHSQNRVTASASGLPPPPPLLLLLLSFAFFPGPPEEFLLCAL